MNATPFLSCDWGTTSLRIRWIEPGLSVARELKSASGSRSLYEKALGENQDRSFVYESFLREILRSWEPVDSPPMPLVISGMASSTVGWREVPYLQGPLELDGSNLRFEQFEWNSPRWIGATYLISGVAIPPEIMRGEETEAIGIFSAFDKGSATLVLPGTHSKHLQIQAGRVDSIATYMTGELFDVLSRQSLLRASVDLNASEPDMDAFSEGVGWARKHRLGRSLFRVRTRAVLDGAPGKANTWFLSGLLIGSEMRELVEEQESEIVLAGAGQFARLYSAALSALETSADRWSSVSPEIVEDAVARGHALFLKTKS